MFKVIKPLRVQGYIEVRIGSGKDVVKHTTISNTKGLCHFKNKEGSGLAERRQA